MKLVVCCLAVLSVAGGVNSGHAQIRGIVVDENGRPLIAVAAEAWTSERRVAVAVTDQQGKFAIQLPSELPTQIIFSRLGYSRAFMRYTGADSLVKIILTADPIAIAPITARASREVITCPQKEQAQARAVWEKVRQRYSTDMLHRGWSVHGAQLDESRTQAELGWYDQGRLRWFWQGSHGYLHTKRASLERFGYGLLLNRERGEDDFDPETGAWIHPKLHASAAYHFASDLFGERHILFVISRAEDATVLGFCPRSKRAPEIKGKVAVEADSAFTWASWDFITPKEDEDAGGRVQFSIASDPKGANPHLVAREGVFWRRPSGSKRYFQYAYEFANWIISPDECWPEHTGKSSGERVKAGCTPR